MNIKNHPMSRYTPEIVQLLEDLRTQLSKPKHLWTHPEIQKIYQIYNLYHQTNKPMTTCGACVTNTTNSVRKIWQEYNQTYGSHSSEGTAQS